MFDFLKKSTWSFVSVIIRALGVLLVNKIFAIQFGTGGITLLAHFQNLTGIITQLPNDGVNRGIIRYWSGNELNREEKQRLFIAGFIFNLILFLTSAVIIMFFSGYFFRDFNIPARNSSYFLLFFLALFLFLVHLFLLAIILSFQQVRIYAVINMFTALVILGVVLLFAKNGSLIYTLLGYIFAQAAGLLFSLVYVIRKKYLKIRKASLPPEGFSKLGDFVLMALSVVVFGKLTDFFVRDYAIQHFGLHTTGLWQSVVKISDSYMMLFINTVGIVYYPQVSALVFDPEKLRVYLLDVVRIVLFVSISGLSLIYLFREPVLIILFNRDFLPAEVLMPFQLTGDFFCFLSYLLTYIISAQARTGTFVMLQAGSAVLYIGLAVMFADLYGVAGIPAAHAIRYGVLLVFLIFLNKRIIF